MEQRARLPRVPEAKRLPEAKRESQTERAASLAASSLRRRPSSFNGQPLSPAASSPHIGPQRRPSSFNGKRGSGPLAASSPNIGQQRRASVRRPSCSGRRGSLCPWLDRGNVTSGRALTASTTASSSREVMPNKPRTKKPEVNNISQVAEALAQHHEELHVPYKSLGQQLGTVIEKWVTNPRNHNATRVFNLQRNHLSLPGAKSIFKAVQYGHVISLNLAWNSLGPDAGKVIAEVLKKNPKLLVLDLRGNPLKGEGCAAIVESLETNNTLTDLDLSETRLDPASGQRIATVLRRSNLRKLMVDGNGLNSSTLAMIEASLCFQPAIWNGTAKVTVALEKAIRLDPSIGPDMAADFLSAVVDNYWPRDDPATSSDATPGRQLADATSRVVAALHAPLAVEEEVLDHACLRSMGTGNSNHRLEYNTSRLTEICRLYLPLEKPGSTSQPSRSAGERLAGSWEQVDLPRGRISADGLLVLNLTPFPVRVGREQKAVAPLGHHRMEWARPPQFARRSSPSPSDCSSTPDTGLPQLDLHAVMDCSRLAGGAALDVPVAICQPVGECRYCLDLLAGTSAGRAEYGSGTLRAMYSVKDYPSVATAQMVMLVWVPPPALRALRLDDLERRWQDHIKSSTGHGTLKRVVSLRCLAGGKLLSAPSSSTGRATTCGDTGDKRLTRFELLRQGDGRVRLRSLCDESEGNYLTVHKEDRGCSLRLGGSGPSQFRMVDNGDSSTFSFRTVHGSLAIFEDGSVGTLPQSETSGQMRESHFQVERGPNMYEVVKYWISPETAVARCSFASLFDYGPPDTFVSHYWGHSFDDMLKSSRLHGSMVAEGDEGAGSRRRLWICSFANDQRRVSEELGKDIDESAFKRALESRTCTAMALMFGEDGAPLQRCWCLYEILKCEEREQQMQLDICTPKGVVSHGGARVDISIDVLERCNTIDVATATCTNCEDARMIRAKIEQSGGPESMNKTIRMKLVEGLEKAIELQDDRMLKAVDCTGFHDEPDPASPGSRRGSPRVAGLSQRLSQRVAEGRSDVSLWGTSLSPSSRTHSIDLEPENLQPKKEHPQDFQKQEKIRLENIQLNKEITQLRVENTRLKAENIQLKQAERRSRAELDAARKNNKRRSSRSDGR